MSFLESETENVWESDKAAPDAVTRLDTLTLEDSGVWDTRTSTPSPAVALNPQRALIDDLDPYGHASTPQPPASDAHTKEQPTAPGKEATIAHEPAGAHAKEGQPHGLPSFSLSALSTVFKRSPTTTPTRSNTPQASTSKVADSSDEASLGSSKAIPASSEEQPFDFNRFMDQMRSKPADPIAKYLRSFLKEFSRRQWRVNDQIRVINDFLDFIAEKMRGNELWRNATEKEFDNAVEAMEKLVMNRLYHLTFTPALEPEMLANNPTDDLERDTVLDQRIRLFSWIKEEHLDLPPSEDTMASIASRPTTPTSPTKRQMLTTGQDYLEFAQRELCKINQYKAPRDKLITILNSCKIIFGLIRHNGSETAGADAFVPYLIFVVLKANPQHLISNIQYIQRFRNPEKLQGEAGYYLSSLTGVITFIESMDHSSLSNITQDDFEHYVEQAIVDLETPDRVRSPPAAPNVPQHRAQPSNATLISQAEDRDASAFFVDGLANTREFIVKSSDIASKTISKPLNAIGKIFTELGQQDSPLVSSGTAPPSPSQTYDDNDQPRRRRGYTPSLYSVQSSTPSRSQSINIAAPEPIVPSAGFRSEDYVGDSMPIQAIQARIDQSNTNQQQANLDTLAAMFPSIDAEVREVVLISRQNDLSATIDALLEMA